MWDLIDGMRRKGRTVLLTTHYLEEAETLCDRVAIMDHGKILELGTIEELVSRRFKERSVRFDAVDRPRRHAPHVAAVRLAGRPR